MKFFLVYATGASRYLMRRLGLAGPEIDVEPWGECTRMANESFKAAKKFYDDKNYPRGFARSGDFTTAEAALLEKHGAALRALAEGMQQPASAEESQFVGVARGEIEATTAIEKVWIKYIKRTTNKKFYTLFGKSKQAAGEEVSFADDSGGDDFDD